ncbi:uncharacterized protein RCO7_14919 [Rhynchosporium graminicola]|uniref:Uncharacterized protein n=1 Tax=Rhynchosporium graminicola TaxID=2792576 RepID=A0A1E1LAC0_9HELO|nr:uncharacterized protein RCO7_14919 [Rhynchosporium commune]
MTNQMTIVDILIEGGADIHGIEDCNPFEKKAPYPFATPLYLPIFAADIAMARHGCIKIMQRCLELGADIIRRSHIYEEHFWPKHTTPLLFNLESIEG